MSPAWGTDDHWSQPISLGGSGTGPTAPSDLEILQSLWDDPRDVAMDINNPLGHLVKVNLTGNKPRRSTMGRIARSAFAKPHKDFDAKNYWAAGVVGGAVLGIVWGFASALPGPLKLWMPWVWGGYVGMTFVLAVGNRFDWHWRPVYNWWLERRRERADRLIEYEKQTTQLRIDLAERERLLVRAEQGHGGVSVYPEPGLED